MFKRFFMATFLMGSLLSVAPAKEAIVVLGETPVAEFTLPDGSVLKNAFVWRRSSEGLMIVHDDGQFFLNFKLLSEDWKAAYLGESAAPVEEVEGQEYEISDPQQLMPILKTIPGLTPNGRNFILRTDADESSEKHALALGILHSLLSGKLDDAKRLFLVVEEKGLDIEGVERDILFVECSACDGNGRIEVDCTECNGTGKCPKCGGDGKRDTGIGKGKAHCTACRGKGQCFECKGVGNKTTTCRACRGRGKLLKKSYCEVKRDFYVHTVNNTVSPNSVEPVTRSDRDRVLRVLRALPELEHDAVTYYVSEEYTGAMDTNILAVCVLHSLARGNKADAERFHLTIKMHCGERANLDIDKYLKMCSRCEGKGEITRDCGSCGGSGKCTRCDGDGERDTDFKDKTIPCTTCRGTGKCTGCVGTGEKKAKCSTCAGTGRALEEERTKIRIKLLVDELNRFYSEQ